MKQNIQLEFLRHYSSSLITEGIENPYLLYFFRMRVLISFFAGSGKNSNFVVC